MQSEIPILSGNKRWDSIKFAKMAGFSGNDLRFTKHMSLDGSTR